MNYLIRLFGTKLLLKKEIHSPDRLFAKLPNGFVASNVKDKFYRMKSMGSSQLVDE
jgi:hypothetical protein